MNNVLRGSSTHLPSLVCALLLGCGTLAGAEEFDIRNLDLGDYTYPGSQVIEKRQERVYANMTLLARAEPAEVVRFYENMGLQLGTADKDAQGVPEDRVVFAKRMLSAHASLTVMFDSNGSQGHNLDDHDLFHDLDIYVATGAKTQEDLDAVRQRFGKLTQRFYQSSPGSLLHDCKSSKNDAREMSMEERGRRMQELAMQGRTDEVRKMMDGLMNDSNLSSTDGIAADKWNTEIECLEKLERESYPIQITVVADRDDLLG